MFVYLALVFKKNYYYLSPGASLVGVSSNLSFSSWLSLLLLFSGKKRGCLVLKIIISELINVDWERSTGYTFQRHKKKYEVWFLVKNLLLFKGLQHLCFPWLRHLIFDSFEFFFSWWGKTAWHFTQGDRFPLKLQF